MNEIIQNRKATRSYNSSFKIDSKTLNKLIELGQAAPSSFNIQHCRFVLVTNERIRQKIRDVAMNQAQVTDASILIIVCAKLDAWKESIANKWPHVNEQTQKFIRQSIDAFYQNNPELERDEALRSSGMASQNLMLAAEGMGLQSGAIIGFNFKKVADLIELPNNHIISNFVVIGKSNETHATKSSRLPLNHVLIENKFTS